MSFAKIIFRIAGIWGLLILTPLYFFYDRIGRDYPPPITHPDFYYGFVGVALVWQIAFLVIGSNPVRFRPLMIVAMLEKFCYVITLVALHLQGRLAASQAAVAVPDFVLGILFVVAWVKTPARPDTQWS
jgi:hypothetical protein